MTRPTKCIENQKGRNAFQLINESSTTLPPKRGEDLTGTPHTQVPREHRHTVLTAF